jgi:hypothetical protein
MGVGNLSFFLLVTRDFGISVGCFYCFHEIGRPNFFKTNIWKTLQE